MVSSPALEAASIRAERALRRSPIHEIREIRVQEENGKLILSGVVSSFYFKQLAQEVLIPICDQAGLQLVNELIVPEA